MRAPLPGKAPFRLPLAAFVLAAGLAAPHASAGPDATGDLRRRVMEDEDPEAAEAFLASDQAEAARAAPDRAAHRELFLRAAELKDLADLLRSGAASADLRRGLLLRTGCRFCSDSAALRAWSRRRLPDVERAWPGRLGEAMLDWRGLGAAPKRWLESRGVRERSWEGLSLAERASRLRPWAAEAADALSREDPRSLADARRFGERAESVKDFLDPAEAQTLLDRAEKARVAAVALADAEKKLERAGTPELRRRLEEAKNAGDVDTRLETLSSIFDGLGESRADVRTAAPPGPGQTFDAGSRRAVAALLASGLMRKVSGTSAGADIEEFYAKQSLRLSVDPRDRSEIATYEKGAITFSERWVQDYLLAKGRAIVDLSRDPALLDALVTVLSPPFVHEATHHRQDVWGTAQGLPWDMSVGFELEAMQNGALFVLEKAKSDPAFARRLEEDRADTKLAGESMGLAERLQRGGPAFFRDTVGSGYYPHLLSLEGATWTDPALNGPIHEDIRRELARREGLTAAEKRALEKAAGPTGALDESSLRAQLPGLGTPILRQWLTLYDSRMSRQPEIYEKLRARQDEANRLLDERLAALQNGPRARRAVGGVPAPGGRP